MYLYLLASNASSGMLAAGMLIVIFLLLRRSRRYLGKTKKQKPSTRRKLDDARQATPLLDAPPEILRWHVEMHEATRHLKAELDSKMSALQAIIRIASEESARLEAAIARAELLGISPCADTLAAIEELNGSDDSDGGLLPDASLARQDELAARRAAVYQLADRGLAASAIARSIGAPLGDIELLMSLRTNGASHDVG
ncbi:MAG: hypothetical protein O3C40_16420 [Planctomycetota bacterium]|nr:hypothetical protein [Planctomycetota bacterium]